MVSPLLALVPVRPMRTVRLLSLLLPPDVRAPWMVPTLSLTDVIEGALGAVVSTVKAAKEVLADPRLPA